MMASEPVPACATTNATAIQITQQPTFIGAPLMVPNPALSRFNSGVQTTTTTSKTTTNSVTEDMSTPGVLKTENQEEHQTNTQTANSAANGTQPQKHFTNTDTQTADLPGDQWHRPPFHRIGMPNKNIPVANVNPMPHTKCASPALHPKKQILFQTQTANGVQGQERVPMEVKPEVPSGAETNSDQTLVNQESISLKPEYSSSGDVKVDMSGHEQYISKIKERLMRRMHPDGSCDSGQDVKVKHDGKGSHGNGSSVKHLKRKYNRSGPGKYTAPLMKKAAQAMKREHVPYHHSSQQQQQGSPHAQAHGKPVLSKTVLDLSDITGESVDEGEHYSRIRSPHKRLGHTQLKGSQSVSKRLGIQKLKEVRLPRQQKIDVKVKEEKKEADGEYGGETEVENSEDSQGQDTDTDTSDYKPPNISRTERFPLRPGAVRTRQIHTRTARSFVRARGKTGRRRNNSYYNKNAAYERELRKEEYRKLLIRYRRKSRSTRSGNRSSTKRGLRALAEIPDYNDYSDDDMEFLDDDGEANDVRDDDEDFLPVGRGRGKLPLIRKRFLPKGKRTFFKGKHDGWGSLNNKRRRWRRRGGYDSDGSMSRSSSRFNDDSRDGFDTRQAPADMRKMVVCKETGETLLHKAARLGNEEVVRYILETHTIDANARDNAGYTPLHESCVRGHLRVAKLLIIHGADVNAAALDGTRPIHDAVDNNHVELARLALACGADMKIATYSGRTCTKLARSLEMQHLINGYVMDLNERDDAIPWEFYGSKCTDSSNKDSGCDIFANVPSDDEPEAVRELPDCDVMFEFSDVPLLPVYTITLKENEGPRHYYLLKNVLQKLHMGKKELLTYFPDLYICNISSVSSQVKDMHPSVHRMLQLDKGFDIVKVSDTLDAALGYTREFLYPELAHKDFIDLPDSKASKVCADHAKTVKNSENVARVKRKYTKRNKNAQNANKKAANNEVGGGVRPKDKKIKNIANQDVGKKKHKKNTCTGEVTSSVGHSIATIPSGSSSDTLTSRSKEQEQDGSELPVLEKHHVVMSEVREHGIVVPTSGDLTNEDPEMPELTRIDRSLLTIKS